MNTLFQKLNITELFEVSKVRFIVKISVNNLENIVIKFVKEYLLPNKYNIYFEHYFIGNVFKCVGKHFKGSNFFKLKVTRNYKT